jgi:Flp pilus assembly protein CpaB
MSGRVRLLIVVALLVVLIGVGAAILLGGNRPTTPAAQTTGTRQAQSATTAPGSTALPAASPIPTVDIVVAIQPIGRGQLINGDMVALRTWPEEYAPINALFSLEDVIGKIARTDIVREQPILNGLITQDLNDLGAVGSDAAAVLPEGTRLISIPIDSLTTGGYAIQPGDRVDAIISLLFVDLDEEFQSILPNGIRFVSVESPPDPTTGLAKIQFLGQIDGRSDVVPFLGRQWPVIIAPQEPPRPRLTTQMTIQDALVVYLGEFPPDGRLFRIGAPTPNPQPDQAAVTPTPSNQRAAGTPVPTAAPQRPGIISLAVSPQDAVVLAYYVESKIPVTFALRPAGEVGTQTTQPVTLEYIMRRYSIQLPTKLPYGVEPAIRSIRQLIASEQIVFRSGNSASPQPTANP